MLSIFLYVSTRPIDYESDVVDDPDYIVSNDFDEGDCEVEFIGVVDNRNIGCVGDTVTLNL